MFHTFNLVLVVILTVLKRNGYSGDFIVCGVFELFKYHKTITDIFYYHEYS